MIISLGIMISGFVLFFKTFPRNIVSDAVNFAFLKICQSSSWIDESIVGMYNEIKTARESRMEIDKLKSEISKLRDIIADYYEIKRENARLIKYYNIKRENPQMKFASASVIGNLGSIIFIDAGMIDGISRDDVVITENGLVGRISNANAFTSTVKTVLSADASIGAIDSSVGGIGVISGEKNLAGRNLTRLTLIASRESVSENDILTTTGFSGIYPKGIKIGTIKSIEYDNASYYAVVEPFEKISEVKNVFVITDFRGKGMVNLSGFQNNLN